MKLLSWAVVAAIALGVNAAEAAKKEVLIRVNKQTHAVEFRKSTGKWVRIRKTADATPVGNENLVQLASYDGYYEDDYGYSDYDRGYGSDYPGYGRDYSNDYDYWSDYDFDGDYGSYADYDPYYDSYYRSGPSPRYANGWNGYYFCTRNSSLYYKRRVYRAYARRAYRGYDYLRFRL
jgi:hypothetical protein